jgi:ParB family chromosome partitioning protein
MPRRVRRGLVRTKHKKEKETKIMSSTETRNRNEYQTIALAELQDSTTNPRTRIDQNALNELAENIKQKDILQPLLVRPLEDKRFEVVFGRRRFLAAQLAEQKAAPCRIRPMSDAEAMEAQIIENRQRQDVHPLEEARAFKALLDLPEAKHTPATLAAKVSKAEAYVVNRVRLTELIEPVAQAFLADEIAIGHALLIAKLPAAQQQEAFNAAFRQTWTSDGNQRVLIPARELAAWIHTNILLELAAAPFSKSDEKLLPEAGSCANCPKRTGFNALLFADVRKDSCTDPQCFQAKINAHVAQTIVRKPELVQISSAHGNRADAPLGRNHYVELQTKATGKNGKSSPSSPAEKPCRSATEAIVMDGGRRGQIVKVCADPKCRIHNADHQRPTSEDVEKQRTAERKRIETQKIEITLRHHVLAAILRKNTVPPCDTRT